MNEVRTLIAAMVATVIVLACTGCAESGGKMGCFYQPYNDVDYHERLVPKPIVDNR